MSKVLNSNPSGANAGEGESMSDELFSSPFLWQKQRRDDISAASDAHAVVLQPIGSIEQHGRHLPLDTDSWTAGVICVRAAALAGELPVLVLPPVWWGLSPYWMTFAGTVSLRVETILALLGDIAASVREHGFDRLVLVNGHGGNSGLIEAMAAQLSDERLRVAAVSYWKLAPETIVSVSEVDHGSSGHSGEMETSIQLYLQQSTVDLGRLEARDCTDIDVRAKLVGGTAAYLPPNPGGESPSGVYGAGYAGTAEKGKHVVEAASIGLAEFVKKFWAAYRASNSAAAG